MRKALLVLITLILIALPAVAEEPLPQPIQVVATVLQLSPDQIAALVAMIQQREQHRQAIANELQSATPDPQKVGQLVIETHLIEQQFAAHFEDVLTPDQRERLHGIRAASQVCPVIPAFSAAGLL